MSHKEKLISRAKECLDNRGWTYHNIPGHPNAVSLDVTLHNELDSVRVVVIAGDAELQFFAFCPEKAGRDVYSTMAELITRANFDLKIGKLEFNYDTGEVRAQCCIPCEESIPSMKDIDNALTRPLLLLLSYGDNILKVIRHELEGEDLALAIA